MNLLRIMRFFLPLENPIGFGASDFIQLGLAILFIAVILLRARIEELARRVSRHPAVAMLVAAVVPVALRVSLLGSHPVPSPRVADDFSYLLLADTLRHFRLANPMHPMHRFFEAVFVLQKPTYSSIFPPGQGFALAFGRLFFGHPWAGVVLSVAIFCALCFWMLCGWTTPLWAFAGALLAGLEFGPLSAWMNTYWGGAVSACAGCLVFGSVPRLQQRKRTRHAVLLGGGLGLQLITRPWEFILLIFAVAFSMPQPGRWRIFLRPATVAALGLLPFAGIMLIQNKQVTGNWETLPYMLSRYQYGVPAAFTFQPNPVPHKQLTVEQQIDYDAQIDAHGSGVDTAGRYFQRLADRMKFARFFLLPPLYFALLAYLLLIAEYRYLRVLAAIAIFWLGDNFYPYFFPHYVAAAACLFILISAKGLAQIARFRIRGIAVGREAAWLIALLCLAHFLFWYGIHLSGNENAIAAMSQYEGWDQINYGDPQSRIAINKELSSRPGKQLVFVRFGPQHGPTEWIHNEADIDRSHVVWAVDLGPDEDARLLHYYPDRTPWLLEPDARPIRLTRYIAENH